MAASYIKILSALNRNEAEEISGFKYDLPEHVINGENTIWIICSYRVRAITLPFEDICPSYDFEVFVIAVHMSSSIAAIEVCKKLGMGIVVPNSMMEYRVTNRHEGSPLHCYEGEISF